MSRKEVPRAGLLKAALAGTITNAQGVLALHLSVQQFQLRCPDCTFDRLLPFSE